MPPRSGPASPRTRANAQLATEELSSLTGIEFMVAIDLVEATSDTGAFVTFSGILRRIAVKISKICNDLRLLSSGPRAGFHEINLPSVQPGSSIMPGKVNPVIPEVVNQVAFEVIGNDLTVAFAAEGGQLQLNAFEPVIAFNILESTRIMTRAMNTLADRCIAGITPERGHPRGSPAPLDRRGHRTGAGDRLRRGDPMWPPPLWTPVGRSPSWCSSAACWTRRG